MKNFEKKYAFSVAEILLTLSIIGIIITFCLPALLLSYKKNTTAVTLKDVYKELNVTITNLTLRNGCTDLVCKDLLTNFTSYLTSEYQINKTCIDTGGDCWNNKVYLNINKNSTDSINYNESGNNFVDAKDRIYNIEIIDPTCNTSEAINVSAADTVPLRHKLKKVCGYITVDIDGNKNTNIYGVDVFKFVLTNTKNSYLYPFGGKYHTHYWRGIDAEVSPSCQPENNFFNGETCGGRIMEENWKINYFDK